jgi:hypothetical protein
VADFLLLDTVIGFFRECFATPSDCESLTGFPSAFVFGLGLPRSILFWLYAAMPNSAMRTRTSSLGASLLGTFLRTKRVISVSTPNFISAYLANCL